MTDTIHLGMPFIEGSQAQKHVTHNEALRILDAVIQIGVLDSDRTAPPLSPAEGDRHIVASGASGAWADHVRAVAVYEDGAWRYLMPKSGWCAWSAADAALLVFDGSSWTEAVSGGGGGIPDSVDLLGINGEASEPNLLSVTSNAALFKAIAIADGGTGDMRVQISKEDSSGTASVVFSNAFAGHAEFGLVESDSFKLKVSDDGETFVEALTFDSGTGNAAFPRGVCFTGVISPPQLTANQNDYAPDGFAAASVLRLSSDAGRTISGLAGGAEGRAIVIHNIGAQGIVLTDQDASSGAANRFLFGGNVTLGAAASLSLRYDGTTQRWRAVSPTASGGGGGGGGPGMSDIERRNLGLSFIYQSKTLGDIRRGENLFATGFKASSDSLRGIATGSSSNVDTSNAATSGYVAIGTTTQTSTANTASTSSFGAALTQIDRTVLLANNAALTSIGFYSSGSGGVANIGVMKRNSAGNYTVVYQQTGVSHAGGGWRDFAASYTVPSSGDYYLFASNTSGALVPTNSGAARVQFSGATTSGATYSGLTEDTGQMLPMRASYPATAMSLVTASQSADGSISNGRVLIEFDDAASITLDTDLTAEVTCNGGTSWHAAALLPGGKLIGQSGRKVVESAEAACTAGTAFAARIKTLNGKNVPIHGVSLTVR